MRKRFFPKFLVIVLVASSIISCQSGTDRFVYQGLERSGIDRLMYYTDVINENGPSVELVYNLAYSYLAERMYDEALMVAREGMRIYPDELRFLMLTAYAEREGGSAGNYVALLEKILSVIPGDEEMMVNLMKGLSDIGDQERADEVAFDILRINPDRRDAIDQLAKHYPFFQSRATNIKEEAKDFDLRLFTPVWELPLMPYIKDIEVPMKGIYQRLLSPRFVYLSAPLTREKYGEVKVPYRPTN